MRAGEVISAEVVRIDYNFVVVNAGLKSEAYVPIEEFKNDQGELEVQVGDFVSVAIDAVENGYGDTILSRDKAKRLASWLSLETALESGDFVTGTVSGKVKGGLTVLVNGIRAFLPGSLIDTRPVKDLSPYEGKTMEFKVIKLDRKRNNVVLSRRAVVEASMGEERAKLLETLSEGAIVNGVVKNITEYGAFVDLGGIDGLLHITDMAWRRVRHPSEVVTVGQELQAKVLKFDAEKNRVSLGIKQLGDDPWHGVSRRYPEQHPPVRQGHQHRRLRRVRRDRTRHRRPGARLRDGLDQQERRPAKVVTLGDEVEVMVLEIDEDKRRISLGMKQCKANPWEEFAARTQARRQGQGPDQVDHRLRRVRGPGGRHRRPGAPVRPVVERDRRSRRAQLQEGPGSRSHRAGRGRRARAHQPGHQAAGWRPVHQLHHVNDRGAWSPARSRPSTRVALKSTSATTSSATCAPAKSAATAWKMPATCSRKATKSPLMVVNVDRKTRNIQLSIKAKDTPTSKKPCSA
jgi:small subunit ribosomal protein S1